MSGPGEDSDGDEDHAVDEPTPSESTEQEAVREETTDQADESSRDSPSLFDRYSWLTVPRVVVALAVVAVLARILTLGSRPAHWDEARVAYWSYFYTETGSLGYHYEEHGPLAQIVAARLFGVLGVSDFTVRLPVAVVGGLLPLSALLFREHLRKTETVALGFLLAANAVLLYYSRFFRSDILVATFMFVALGLFVRFSDTRKPRYLIVAGVAVGLGFASKENAVLYILTWLGATALVFDQYLHSPASTESGFERVKTQLGNWRSKLRSVVLRTDYAIGFLLSLVATLVVLFAPRGQGVDGRYTVESDADPLTLGSVVQNPGTAPEMVDETLRGAYDGYVEWFAQSEETTLDGYISFLSDYITVLVEYAPLVTVFAVVGIVIERYTRTEARVLVMFLTYCGIASLVGYPLGSHIEGDSAWLSVHVILPLTVPAAVGLSWSYRRVRQFVAESSLNLFGLLVAMLVLCSIWAWFVPVQAVYLEDTADDNELVQFAQAHSDLSPLTEEMDKIATENTGTDVMVYYGQRGTDYDNNVALVDRNRDPNVARWDIRPVCSVWGETQPLNWYFAATGVSTDCERSADELATAVSNGEIPMVVTLPDDDTVPAELENGPYDKQTYYLRTLGQETVVYTHENWSGT